MTAARLERSEAAEGMSYAALVRAGKIKVSNVIVLNCWLADRNREQNSKAHQS